MRPQLQPRVLATAVLAAGLALTLVEPALAQTTTTGATGNLGTIIQNVINLLTNNVTRGLAILAIIATGVLWLRGRLDIGHAAAVIGGIMVIFGAATIADAITGATGS